MLLWSTTCLPAKKTCLNFHTKLGVIFDASASLPNPGTRDVPGPSLGFDSKSCFAVSDHNLDANNKSINTTNSIFDNDPKTNQQEVERLTLIALRALAPHNFLSCCELAEIPAALATGDDDAG